MSRGTAKKAKEVEVQPQLIFDAKRDINPFWRSSLFSDVYLKNDVPREYKHLWENDEIGGFHDFYQGFVDLCVETEHECFEKWREADTVGNWIVHVMDLLGWENNSERRSNSYMDNESFTVVESGRKQTFRPDLIYFDKPKHKAYTQKEKDIDKKLLEARSKKTGAKIVVEAKYWDRLSQISDQSSKDTKVNDSASALGPELQTLKYMEILDHDFGILTDGKTWRLFHCELSQGMDRRSFDFDLGNLRELALDLASYQNEEKFRHYAKYFYYFFSKESLVQSDSSKTAPFVHEVFEYSKKYAHSIEEDLKKRFIQTMGVTCNAIKSSCDDLGEEIDLEIIRNVSESHLFNILFIKSCEVRRVLPISSTQYLRKSLHEVVETIDAMEFDPDKDWDDYLRDFRFSFGKKFDWDGYEIFNRFINLYEIVHDGTAKSKDFGFEIDGFKESIFSNDEWRFAKKHKLSNKDMVLILFNLNFIESSFKGRRYQQIPYSYFTARQLGAIYESFLEYRLEIAPYEMIFTKGKWDKANLKSKKVKSMKLVDTMFVKKNDLFFSPNNEDRKMTGSYYTPDYITKRIVKDTLEPILAEKTCEEVLNVKICDPAMGSGHFLSAALDYIVLHFRNKWSEENNDDIDESIEETSRKVLNGCIYGVDINPRAVKLAKMSLWLLTAYPGRKLERLDDQLFSGDSLISRSRNYQHGFSWDNFFKNRLDGEKFDAIVSNPPYLKLQGIFEFQSSNSNYFEDNYESATERYDLYVLFVERSLELINTNGRIGMIIPSKYTHSSFGRGLRSLLSTNQNIEKIVDFSHHLVFDAASVYTQLLFLSKSGNDSFKYLCDKKLSPIELLDRKFEKNEFYSEYTFEDIGESPWELVSSGDKGVYKKLMSKLSTEEFSNLFEMMFVGIQSGVDDIHYLDKTPKPGEYRNKRNGKVVKIEQELVRELITGRELKRYSKVKTKQVVIYPYKLVNGKTVAFSETEMKKKFPNGYKYLLSFKDELYERRVKQKRDLDTWYACSCGRNINNFERIKIGTPEISKECNMTILSSDIYHNTQVYSFIVKEEYEEFRSFLLGYLNNPITWFLLQKRGSVLRGGSFRFKTKYFKDFPLPNNKFFKEHKAEVKKIGSLVDKLLKKYDESIDAQISSLFYKIFDLSGSEISTIEGGEFQAEIKQVA